MGKVGRTLIAVVPMLFLYSMSSTADGTSVLDQARNLFAAKDYKAVIALLQSADLSDQLQFQQAQLLIGRSYQEQKEYAEAVNALEAGLRIDARDKITIHDLKATFGQCYFSMGSFDKAISLYEAMTAEFPDESMTWESAISDCYFARGSLYVMDTYSSKSQ